MSDPLAGYAADAASLIPAYEAIDPPTLYRHVTDWIPKPGETVLDIGAGTGRDAAHWRALGCDVTAVEPVAALWAYPNLPALRDTLPHLVKVVALGRTFDVIMLTGVLHHLSCPARDAAFPVLRDLLNPAGRMVLSLRHGPAPADRPAYPICPDQISEVAQANDLEQVSMVSTPSIGARNIAAGVHWTWAVFRK